MPGEKTFRWAGEYGFDLNEAKTLDTQLNAFARFKPSLPASHRAAPFLFLANIDPELQLDVRRQMDAPMLTALDTMNFWIDGKREALLRVLREVDVLLINDAEARMLAKEPNLIKAARAIVAMGPRVAVIKRGEYGSLMVATDEFFFAPAYPLESVFDPTGAGDTFAGGFLGYLAQRGTHGHGLGAKGDDLRRGDGLVHRRGLLARSAQAPRRRRDRGALRRVPGHGGLRALTWRPRWRRSTTGSSRSSARWSG